MDKCIIAEHPDYTIDRRGNVYNKKGKRLKPRIRKNSGYYAVVLYNPKKSWNIARLVGKYFVPNPDNKPEINHKDGDRSHNSWDNLEWVTRSENELHAYRILGKSPSFGKSSLCIKVKRVRGNQEEFFNSMNEACRVSGNTRDRINNIINRSRIDSDGYLWYNT